MLESLIKNKTVKRLVSIVAPLVLASGFYLSAAHADVNKEGKVVMSKSNIAYDFTPCWSPDGKKIAFMSDRDRVPFIYIMDIEE